MAPQLPHDSSKRHPARPGPHANPGGREIQHRDAERAPSRSKAPSLRATLETARVMRRKATDLRQLCGSVSSLSSFSSFVFSLPGCERVDVFGQGRSAIGSGGWFENGDERRIDDG